jgi:hypothetical protein
LSVPVRVAFLGCGCITRLHRRQLRMRGGDVLANRASRVRGRADDCGRPLRSVRTGPADKSPDRALENQQQIEQVCTSAGFAPR